MISAELLNRICDCSFTHLAELRARLDANLSREGGAGIVESHPHLYSEAPVFIEPEQAGAIQQIVAAVEAISAHPAYQQRVLAGAPPIAREAQAAAGVCMGFDFHLSADGPKLIEINTNAGGALLNIAALAAQRACCPGVEGWLALQPTASQAEEQLFASFVREFALARPDRALRTVAIVDENPPGQYLYPEFLLARRMFESRGIAARIADPAQLHIVDDELRLGAERIDLVYNRLTDFYFEDPRNRVLEEAYLRGLAVITPHPRAHALFANKLNLAVLSTPETLRSLGVAARWVDTVAAGIPPTRAVDGCGEQWWSDRRHWFFKPHAGYGSRGAYRGDKLTRRVFAEVMNGGYVAQRYTPPAERWRAQANGREAFKFDVRAYTYAGQVQLLAARLYQGQTTNFRTSGGGFAPVYITGATYPALEC